MRLTILAAAGSATLLAAPAQAESLTVELDGVRATAGRLSVSVQTRDQFMQQNGVAGSVLTSPSAGAHTFSFEVPAGEYAVSVWHDDNGNGRFDSDETHRPLDGWAMVNGDQIDSEPRFDQVKTSVADSPVRVRLAMIYGR